MSPKRGPLHVNPNVKPHFLNRAEIVVLTTLSPSTIRRMEADGQFPRRRQIAPGRIGWLTEEVVEWTRSRPVAELPVHDKDYHKPKPVSLLDSDWDG